MLDLTSSTLTSKQVRAYFAKNNCISLTEGSLNLLSTKLQKQRLKNLRHLKHKKDMQKFIRMLREEASDTPEALHDLLANIKLDIDEISHVTYQAAVSIWIHRLNQLLPHDVDFSSLLSVYDGELNTPIQFCALLCVLLKRDISVERILGSELLHRYFTRNTYLSGNEIEMEAVRQAYALLKAYPHIDADKKAELFTKAGKAQSEFAHSKSYALTGEEKDWKSLEVVKRVSPNSPQISALSKDSFHKLTKLFGMSAWANMLQSAGAGEDMDVQSLMSILPEKKLPALCEYISTSISSEEQARANAFAGLARGLSPEKVLTQIIRKKYIAPWGLLNANSEILTHFTQSDWNLIDEYGRHMQASDIDHAFALTTLPLLTISLKLSLLRHIAKACYENPYVSVNVLYHLVQFSEVREWADEKIYECSNELQEQINAHIINFSADSYHKLVRFFDERIPQYRILENFVGADCSFVLPQTTHYRDAFILRASYQAAKAQSREHLFDRQLKHMLSIMHPAERYTKEGQTQADLQEIVDTHKGRVLLAALLIDEDDLESYLLANTSPWWRLMLMNIPIFDLERLFEIYKRSESQVDHWASYFQAQVVAMTTDRASLLSILGHLSARTTPWYLNMVSEQMSLFVQSLDDVIEVLDGIEKDQEPAFLKALGTRLLLVSGDANLIHDSLMRVLSRLDARETRMRILYHLRDVLRTYQPLYHLMEAESIANEVREAWLCVQFFDKEVLHDLPYAVFKVLVKMQLNPFSNCTAKITDKFTLMRMLNDLYHAYDPHLFLYGVGFSRYMLLAVLPEVASAKDYQMIAIEVAMYYAITPNPYQAINIEQALYEALNDGESTLYKRLHKASTSYMVTTASTLPFTFFSHEACSSSSEEASDSEESAQGMMI